MLKWSGHVASIQSKGMHTEFLWRNIIRMATSKNKKSLREGGCEDGRWIELAQKHSQWQAGLDISGFCNQSYVLELYNHFKFKIFTE
jgi:hypothetical protein